MKHLKIMLVPALLCLFVTGASAQSIEKSVIASAGGSYSGPAILVDYTIGQCVTNYATSSSYLVTEGFHPIGDTMLTTAAPVISKTANSLSIQAYPNPVNTLLHIAIQQDIANPVALTVTDVTGKTVKTASFDGQLHTYADLDLAFLASGIYYIVLNAGQENAQVMKIIKN